MKYFHKACGNIFSMFFFFDLKKSCTFVASNSNIQTPMSYPLISEYIDAIKSAEDNFKELSSLRPVLGDDGLPVMTSGNFAVVFKMKDERDGKLYAVKCFTKEQEGRADAYRQITEELKDVSSPFLTSVRYLDKELFVDSKQTNETEFPVLLMDWVEGKTMDKYLRENLDDKYALEMLAYRFSQLAQWLIPQPFAHGDLKPDNILVREDGTLVLVDYDGMYVPAMKGQKARELGSPDFRHPLRTENDFDEHIDEFSVVSIILSLTTISKNSELLVEFCEQNRLLFSEGDYLNINDCTALKQIFPSNDTDTNRLVVVFLYYVLNSSKTRYPITTLLNYGFCSELTKFKDRYYSLSNKYVDEYGVEYTKDKKILLRWNRAIKESTDFPQSYSVSEGTEIICDDAFMYWKNLTAIHLPSSLKFIGSSVFVGTKLSDVTCDSSKFLIDNNIIYSYDQRVIYYYPANRENTYFEVPKQVKKIIRGCFSTAQYLWIVKLNHLQYDFDELAFSGIYVSIPKGTKKYIKIDYRAYSPTGERLSDEVGVRNNIFEGDLVVDDGVIYSSDKTILYCYPYWLDREEYIVDEKCKIIEEAAFDDSSKDSEYGGGMDIEFNRLKKLILPNGLEEIKEYAFVGCGFLENLTIPCSVRKIGNYVFGQCVNLITITFLSRIKEIRKEAFYVGKTRPGQLINPYEPWVVSGQEQCDVDILICPNKTDEYFKELLDNNNTQFFSMDKTEMQIKSEEQWNLKKIKSLSLSATSQKLTIPSQIKDNLATVVYEWDDGFYINFNRFKKQLENDIFVFDVRKETNRFFYRKNLEGICYVTKNYRSRFISENVSFATYEEAVDFVCTVYHDIYGKWI